MRPARRRNPCRQQHTRRGVHASATLEGMSGTKSALVAGIGLQLPPPVITRSDEAFASDGVEFVYSGDEIDLMELNDLFEKVGFPRRDPDRLRLALTHTHRVLWVRCTRGSRWARLGQLLAFARATSDAALSATIWDVAVNPSWQRSGLGRAAVERLITSLVAEDISTITLYAEPKVVGLYEKLGFQKDPQGIKGMAFQRTSRAGKTLMRGL